MSNDISNIKRLWASWFAVAGREDVNVALNEIYGQIAQAVNERKPICRMSGRCCDFDRFDDGHLLYVTGLEIAWVILQLDEADLPAAGEIDWGERCIFQVDKQCSVHQIRPLGCRVFFCQAGTGDWQNKVYERFQGQLQSMHDRLGLTYRYMEWRRGLVEGLNNSP